MLTDYSQTKIKVVEILFLLLFYIPFILFIAFIGDEGLLINAIAIFPFIILSKFFYSKWINPVIIYSAIWLLMMFLYGIRLIPGPDISMATYVAILLANISFCSGALTISLAKKKGIVNNISQKVPQYNYNLWNIFIFVSSVLGAIAFLIQYLMIGSINYSEIHFQLRQGVMTTGPIEWAKRFTPAAIIMWLIITNKRKSKYSMLEKINVVAVVINILLLLIYPNRSMLFLTIFVYLLYLLIYTDYYKYKKQMVSVILIVVTFFSVLIGSQIILDKVRTESWWGVPYRYIAFNLPNFQYSIEEEQHIRTNGTSTFYLPALVFSNLGLIERPAISPLDGTSNVELDWFNTYPYLREAYRDFGWLGFIIVPYLYGLVVGYVFLKSLYNRGSLILKYMNILLLYSLVLSIRQIPFAGISWTFILLIPLILKYSFKFIQVGKVKTREKVKKEEGVLYET